MKRKFLIITMITAFVLTAAACGKKDVAEATSTISSVVEKVNETTTSIAEKVDNINPEPVKEDETKTDLSNLPEIEVPEVSDAAVSEENKYRNLSAEDNEKVKNKIPLSGMTPEELEAKIKYVWQVENAFEYEEPEWRADENAEDTMIWNDIPTQEAHYIWKILQEHPEYEDVTFEDYFGQGQYSKLMYAKGDNETLGMYLNSWYKYNEEQGPLYNKALAIVDEYMAQGLSENDAKIKGMNEHPEIWNLLPLTRADY